MRQHLKKILKRVNGTMEIYCRNCSPSRFGISKAEDWTPENKPFPHLVLYHLTDPPDQCVKNSLPQLMANQKAFVLCFKGTMLAGLAGQPKVMDEARKAYPGRIHFFAPAVPMSAPGGLLHRKMLEFEAYVRSASTHIDWAVVDPEWKENLLAVYLATRALATKGRESLLEKQLRSSKVFKRIVSEAEEEYQMLSADSNASLDLDPISYAKAGAVADRIWTQLSPPKT